MVEACVECNNNLSLDEQYVACLIESVICGSTNPDDLSRENIKRTLTDTPALASRLTHCKRLNEAGDLVWDVDVDRVKRVVLKLARGHIAYELSLTRIEEPDIVTFTPLMLMSDEQRSQFESPGNNSLGLWPEIGSRAFIRAAKNLPSAESTVWTVVQRARYRYLVAQTDNDSVRFVLSEYLACHVAWR